MWDSCPNLPRRKHNKFGNFVNSIPSIKVHFSTFLINITAFRQKKILLYRILQLAQHYSTAPCIVGITRTERYFRTSLRFVPVHDATPDTRICIFCRVKSLLSFVYAHKIYDSIHANTPYSVLSLESRAQLPLSDSLYSGAPFDRAHDWLLHKPTPDLLAWVKICVLHCSLEGGWLTHEELLHTWCPSPLCYRTASLLRTNSVPPHWKWTSTLLCEHLSTSGSKRYNTVELRRCACIVKTIPWHFYKVQRRVGSLTALWSPPTFFIQLTYL